MARLFCASSTSAALSGAVPETGLEKSTADDVEQQSHQVPFMPPAVTLPQTSTSAGNILLPAALPRHSADLKSVSSIWGKAEKKTFRSSILVLPGVAFVCSGLLLFTKQLFYFYGGR